MFRKIIDSNTELKQLDRSHSAALYALTDHNRTYLRKWLPWLDGIRTEADTRRFVESAPGMQVGVWFQSRLVGVVGFQKIDMRNHKASMGYWLAEADQGRGIMTRACAEMVDYAFVELKLNRVSIRCPSSNTQACKIAERLGFLREGVLPEAEWFYDHYENNTLYGILARNWKRS